MNHPLMPKATAVWLVENTALSFEQIADFCGLHALEVNAIADDEVVFGMQGMNPISAGDLTLDEIERCQVDPTARLNPAPTRTPVAKKKSARYTPVSKRQDRPDAIAWLIKNYPELSDAQISKLIGTTKPTINAIRDRSHWNTSNIKAQNPISLGLCSAEDLEKIVAIARARAGTTHKPNIVPDGASNEVDLKATSKQREEPTAETLFKPISEDVPSQTVSVGPDFLSVTESEIHATEKDTSFEPKETTVKDDEKSE
jgi:uncharacterized protein